MVVGKQYADNGARHTCDGVLEETTISGRDVVGACTREGVVEVDIGVMLGDKTHDTYGSLPSLGIAAVEDVVVPAVAEGGE